MTRLRLARRLSLAELASLSGVSLNTISRASSAERCTWRGSTARDVARALEPFTEQERQDAAAVGLLESPRPRPLWAPPRNDATSDLGAEQRDAWYAALVAKVGAAKAPAVALMIDTMLSLIEAPRTPVTPAAPTHAESPDFAAAARKTGLGSSPRNPTMNTASIPRPGEHRKAETPKRSRRA